MAPDLSEFQASTSACDVVHSEWDKEAPASCTPESQAPIAEICYSAGTISDLTWHALGVHHMGVHRLPTLDHGLA